MMREDLVAERVAIDSYSDMIRYIGDSNPTTRRMLEAILANEEEHAEDLATMLEEFGGESKKRGSAALRGKSKPAKRATKRTRR